MCTICSGVNLLVRITLVLPLVGDRDEALYAKRPGSGKRVKTSTTPPSNPRAQGRSAHQGRSRWSLAPARDGFFCRTVRKDLQRTFGPNCRTNLTGK